MSGPREPSPTAPAARRRGLELPLAYEQLIAGSGEVVFSVLAFVVFGLYAEDYAVPITCAVYAVPVCVVVWAYVYCSTVDPSVGGAGFPCVCMKATQARDRYCRICGKTVPGLDHHCTWLNTCIGRRNYWAFYILATAGIAQYVLHVVFCILVCTVWRREGTATGGIVFTAIVAACGLLGVFSFGSLWMFHTYLLTQGIGTYDWLLRRAERSMAREEQRAAAARRDAEAKAALALGTAAAIATAAAGSGDKADRHDRVAEMKEANAMAPSQPPAAASRLGLPASSSVGQPPTGSVVSAGLAAAGLAAGGSVAASDRHIAIDIDEANEGCCQPEMAAGGSDAAGQSGAGRDARTAHPVIGPGHDRSSSRRPSGVSRSTAAALQHVQHLDDNDGHARAIIDDEDDGLGAVEGLHESSDRERRLFTSKSHEQRLHDDEDDATPIAAEPASRATSPAIVPSATAAMPRSSSANHARLTTPPTLVAPPSPTILAAVSGLGAGDVVAEVPAYTGSAPGNGHGMHARGPSAASAALSSRELAAALDGADDVAPGHEFDAPARSVSVGSEDDEVAAAAGATPSAAAEAETLLAAALAGASAPASESAAPVPPVPPAASPSSSSASVGESAAAATESGFATAFGGSTSQELDT